MIFECYVVADAVFAFTLDAVRGLGYVLLIENNGEINTRNNSVDPSKSTFVGEYFHAELIKQPNGRYSLQKMPYKCSRYPLTDFVVDSWLTHPDGKAWGYSKALNKILYHNPRTRNRLIVMDVITSIDWSVRVNHQLKKGYKKSSQKHEYIACNRFVAIY